MNEFCRTCGKQVVPEHCLQMFSSEGRQMLHCVRTITNCWFQNAPDFPCYMCIDCQNLLRKVQRFRRRCAKIEKYLSKKKLKTSLAEDPATVALQPPIQQVPAADPLGIDELMAPSEVKQEPESMPEENVENKEDTFDETHIEERFSPIPEDYGESQPEISTNQTNQRKIKVKNKSNKKTMRLGRKLIHVKVIDDKQPKRIVDRNSTTAKPCICEHCGRQFKDTSNLNVHLLRHTGTKPFECEQCHQKCYTLHLLRRHQLKHTEGPYACTFCGLEYSTNSSRVRHEREACKKGRAPQSKWEIIKKGERTFHCEVCDLWFLRAGNFTQHINSSSHVENERRKKRKSKSIQSSDTNT
ncbi:hypothetical protein KR067_000589 [Drosophila pandora]|nr:hypothetical protein KR067_000589 [Drosophila pandora]